MSDSANTAAAAGVAFGVLAIIIFAALAVYLFFCFCSKRICEKCGVNPGILIWIPIVQLIPLLQAAQMPVWTIILFFIPIVSIVVSVMMWVKICQARGKSGWLVILMFIPIANIVFFPYLAFSN